MDRHAWIDERLAAVPLFEGLSKRHLREISTLATQLQEPAGTVLTTEGRPGHEFVIVLEGQVEVRHGDEVIAKLGPSEYFGEMALLDDRPRTASVVATTPVVIEVIGQREFSGMLADMPEVKDKIVATMARRLARFDPETTG